MVQMFDAPRPLSGVLGQLVGQGMQKAIERQQQGQQQSQLAQALFGDEDPSQYQGLSPDQQLAIAKLRQQQEMMQQPKVAPGGISGQPVPPEVSIATQNIVEQNPEASADELAIKFDEVGVPRAYSNSYIESRRRQDELKSKRFESERSYQSQRSIPFLKKMDEERASLDQKDQALYLMRDAIDQGDLSFFSKDNFANFLGKYGEGLRTAKGAQLINAQKEFLLGNIGRAGARPNMWIEQQISNMLAKIGRSDEANLTVVESLQAEQDLIKKKQEFSDELVERYERELGYVPGNIAAQVDKMVKPYAQSVQDRLSYRLRNIHENEMGEKQLRANIGKKVTRGTPLTLQTAQLLIEKEGSKDAAIKKAKALGYYIPTVEEYKGYIQ